MFARALATGLALAGLLAAVGCGASERTAIFELEEIGRFVQPTYVTQAPGEPARLYIVEQAGRVRVLEDGRTATFLDIRDQVKSGGEQGLFSIAFDPEYPSTHLLFASFTDRKGDSRVIRYEARGGKAIPHSAVEILFVEQPRETHNGGQLQFGPDGLLYVSFGDGGCCGDPLATSQNLETRLSKILRADVGTLPAEWEIVGYGFRNPWRFSFDRKTGDLLIADVGQNQVEEIDLLPAGEIGETPENFGWKQYEGTRRRKTGELAGPGRLVMPITEYRHDSGRCSVTGGYVYRGSAVPELRGRYLYGDFCSGEIWSFALEKGQAIDERQEDVVVANLSSFAEDATGELYAVSLAGPVYRIVAPAKSVD